VNEHKTDWEQLYRDDFTPWDTGRPDSHLIQTVTEMPVSPCRVLDVGCGTGESAIWLAQQGFKVTAIDISEIALNLSRKKPGSEKCEFIQMDFLKASMPETNYGFIFDMGCFHTFHDDELRNQFAQKVSISLLEKGLWLSISGNCDGPEMGPPRLSAQEITVSVESHFEILYLKATELDELSKSELETLGLPAGTCPRAWACLMRKRSDNLAA